MRFLQKLVSLMSVRMVVIVANLFILTKYYFQARSLPGRLVMIFSGCSIALVLLSGIIHRRNRGRRR
jgi:hypothetical protein